MSTSKAYFLLFRSIHDVLKAEKMLKRTGAEFELVPVPRQISSECGVCIKSLISPKDLFPADVLGEIERCYAFNGTEFTLLSSINTKTDQQET